ncbi:SDR family NAD(P)-dependent oxidoreductase [Gemmatimonas groenlandica]|uniref:SDR family oxidoreductase n=1 Tax=Gemmatimonas groenlandica TaxID=2732249 RepID=A0A6M4ITX8_9BACT|nr:SDR family oxidoreductase [Gemmatimonas groenlandica]QJR38110.1 SDR family oxidoreductase [Gemmatimonas groenlandica]
MASREDSAADVTGTRERRRIPRGRLAGKVAVVTGAAGNIGTDITRRFLEEGATVVMTGRDKRKLEAARTALRDELHVAASRIIVLPMDASEPGQVRSGLAQLFERVGRVDVLVNNAGSAGPKCSMMDLPFVDAELAELAARGIVESETVGAATRNLLGVSWNLVRALTPHLESGASIINVSTIFSRTQYYGRSAYVVPKAALNALSRGLAAQLGPRGIRVNTVFPGPIESPRIRTVFAAMDSLRGVDAGTTAVDFMGLMALTRNPALDIADNAARAVATTPAQPKGFPTVRDVANTIVFLASEDSAAISGHNFEVTHGMSVRQESRSTWVSRPELRTVDGTGVQILVAAGDQVTDALTVARVQATCGARVLLTLGTEEGVRTAKDALGVDPMDERIRVFLLDRSRPDTVEQFFDGVRSAGEAIQGAILFPAFGAWRFRGDLATIADADLDAFLDGEIVGMMALTRALSRWWREATPGSVAPRVVFLSNGDDGAGNVYADVLRAATEELCRVWRDEAEQQYRATARPVIEWSNQIVRWGNRDSEEVPFAAGQAARLLFTRRRIRQVNLYLPTSIVEATGSRRAIFGWMESLMGLHLGKVALITGGSAGIGGQLGRLLAISGARVMLVARRQDQLEGMRSGIVRELEDIGYYAAQDRVAMLAEVDVANEASLRAAVDATIAQFGRIDYLINNAGVAGAEQMVVDMDVDAWRNTLTANLVSNYSLIEKVVPIMKRQGSGYILNVSSYFGGEKYVAVPYPNRADYAVSKAGQRAITENFARFVGPEIQVNAIAPGPVDGDRLRGVGGKPGLFERRGRLILESRRLNAVYAAVIEATRNGAAIGAVLDLLRVNSVPALSVEPTLPPPLRALCESILRGARAREDEASSGGYLMQRSTALRLVNRLRLGGHLLKEPDNGSRFAEAWLEEFPEPPQPFVAASDVAREAKKIGDGVLSMLHLRNMPTEVEVALATVFFLSDRAVSGETFQPSGGLHQERTITERELFGRAKPERVARMQGQTIWLIGEYLTAHLARAARLALEQGHAGRIVLLTRTVEAGREVQQMLRIVLGADRVESLVVGGDLEGGIDRALQLAGPPAAVVSTPFSPLPSRLFHDDGSSSLDAAGFADLVEQHLTHHFRVARKVSLMDDVRLVLVSPDVPIRPTHAEFALANFVKTTLHALTATLGVENERLVHNVPVNQINLTRRVRSEEPRDPVEQAEEQERFAHAVLLASAPLPEAADSRYKARLYRGLAITV